MQIKSPFLLKLPISKEVVSVLISALDSVDPYVVVKNNIDITNEILSISNHSYSLRDIKRIYLIGAGKAAQQMALGVKDKLHDHIISGLVVVKHVDPFIENKLTPQIKTVIGNHPIPDKSSLESTRQLISLVNDLNEDDLVICVISGGGSALLTYPFERVGLNGLQNMTKSLLRCGAEIGEINTIRKHLDGIKGGGLARIVYPAQIVTLNLSDVIGDPLDMIASGPTVADPTTFADALIIVKKYDLKEEISKKVFTRLTEGACGNIPETLKPLDPILLNTRNIVVANNSIAAEAAMKAAQKAGFNSAVLTTFMKGEAQSVGSLMGNIVKVMEHGTMPLPKPSCMIIGGETTVTIKGRGKGGRNQEIALAVAIEIAGLERVCIVTLATDGEDGPTDAAGAVVTGETIKLGRDLGLSAHQFLRNNDSYHYFDRLDSLIVTGPTGTNVNDLAFLFAY
ncbi:MAG TPA: glycerate kinase [Anaerolineae bacterium]|nr:glycerate kinase [Anaerolineae bacterium]